MKRISLIKIIGIIIFFVILTKIDFQKLGSIIPLIRPSYLFAAIVLALFPLLFKAFRWKYILKLQQINYPIKDSFLAYLSSFYAGIVTPAKLGEFVKVFYLQKSKNVSFGMAFSSVMIDRILDLFFLVLFSLAGIFYFYVYKDYLIVLIAFLVLMLIIMALLINKNFRNSFVKILLAVIKKKYKTKLQVQADDFFSGFDVIGKITFIVPVFLTLIAYVIFFFRCYLISRSLDMPVSFAYLAFSISVTGILVLLPITVAGIGIRDASLIFLFWQVGISKEMALAYSFLFLLVINVMSGLVGAFAWMKIPLDISKDYNGTSESAEKGSGVRGQGPGFPDSESRIPDP